MTDISQRLTAALADRYRLERELGAGGMATVYLAHDLRHERDVAIKVLHADLGAALGPDRFLSEIKTTAKLQHPHILPLLDSGNADGLLYYVMPLVTGETLRARLERERQLPIEHAVRIAREVADALGYAHGLSVIHRDIKPENILLQGGHALVADFGIALAVQQAGGARMTQTGLSLGTPQYMSPEQAMGERAIDARSDIYALGAVTYEMLTGEPPFTGPSVQAIVARLITEEPRGIASQRKAVPEHIDAAVMGALEKLPADRFATAAEFATALQGGAVMSTSTHARRRGVAQSPTGRGWTRPRVVAACFALVAAAATIGWAAARLGRPAAAVADSLTATSILAPAGGNFGEQRSLALTPDGRRLAFVFAAIDGSRMLWLRHIDRLDAVPIPQTVGANAPFWSPDGRSLAFFAGGYLTVIDERGDSRRLCPTSAATGGSWSVNGTILFGHDGGMSTVAAGGGVCRVIVPRDAGPAPKGVFLPDGQRFVYSRGREVDMTVADLDGATLGRWPVRPFEFAVVASGYLLYPSVTDTRAVDAQRINTRTLTLEGPAIRVASDVRAQSGVHTFSVSHNGAFAFLPGRVDRPYLEYGANGLLADTVRIEGTWTLSVRPREVGPPLVAVGGNTVGLWLYDLDTDRATRLLMRDSVAPLPGEGYGTTYPVWSRDGSRLIYALIRPTACRIVERNLASDVERVVLQEPTANINQCPFPLDWSADGLDILVRRDTTLAIIAINGAGASRPVVRPGRLWEGQFSPDGRAIAYSSDETGRAEAYVQPLPTGSATRVSLNGARWPTWSHGGRRLTFITPDGRVQEVAISIDQRSPAGAPRTLFSAPTWRRTTFDDRGVGFAMVGDGERYLVRQSTSGLAVAYISGWPTLLSRTSTTSPR